MTFGDTRGRLTVLEFWASWCDPCLTLHPAVVRMAEHYRGQPVDFYGIPYSDTRNNARLWLREHGGIHYQELFDGDGTIARSYLVHAVPQMFLVGPDGRLVSHCFGCASVEMDFVAAIDSVLAIMGRTD